MVGVTGHRRLGLLLALTTAVLWGLLPIALKVVLARLDPYTITWYRFAASALVLGTVLAATQRLPAFGAMNRRTWLLVVIALASLVGNYVLYLVALVHATPTVNQTVIQLAPMFLLLGGLLVFKERFTARQWAGFALLLMGLLLFFNWRLSELRDLSGGLGLGVMLLVIAAIIWAAYGLVQKQLLRHLTSQQILWLIYLGATVVLLPAASPGAVRDLNALQAWMLAFCCLNTLVAYGAFAEALEHLEVSRVSAVLALAPVFTMGGVWIASGVAPGLLEPEGLNVASVAGALLVVGGSALCALGGSRVPALPQPPNGLVTAVLNLPSTVRRSAQGERNEACRANPSPDGPQESSTHPDPERHRSSLISRPTLPHTPQGALLGWQPGIVARVPRISSASPLYRCSTAARGGLSGSSGLSSSAKSGI